jgi:hypothetical protein
VVFSDSATARSEEFWQQARPDSFSLEEKNLVGMVNRMSSDPRWKRTEAILRAIAENWLPLGPVELGDILNLLHLQQIRRPSRETGIAHLR